MNDGRQDFGQHAAPVATAAKTELPRWAGLRWWSYVAVVNVLLVLVTFEQMAGGPGGRLLRRLNLAREQSLGTWWSGLQFLLFALLADSLSRTLRRRSQRASRAWRAMAWVGLLLFADEIGSIHERAEFFMPLPDDLAALPLGVVGGIPLVYALIGMVRERDRVGRAPVWILAGFAAFGLVYALEVLEGRRLSGILRGLRSAAEEGSELLGGMLLLASCVAARSRLGLNVTGLRALLVGRDSVVWSLRVCVLFAPLVIALRLRFTTDELVIPRRGDFGLAAAILAYASGALLALERALLDRHRRGFWLFLAVAFAALSAATEVHFHQLFPFGPGSGSLRNDLELVWGLPLLAAALLGVGAVPARALGLGALGGAILVFLSLRLAYPPLDLVLPTIVSFGGLFLLLSSTAGEGDVTRGPV